jgi:hypothetical protein
MQALVMNSVHSLHLLHISNLKLTLALLVLTNSKTSFLA